MPSQEVGLAILGPLRDLDEVAYLRFASVYRSFTSADDFAAEIRSMRPEQRSAGPIADADRESRPIGHRRESTAELNSYHRCHCPDGPGAPSPDLSTIDCTEDTARSDID